MLNAFLRLLFSCGVAVTLCSFGDAQTDVLTQRYDDHRTGVNLTESVLTASNVKPATFGKIANLTVDGAIASSPLIVSGLKVNGKVRNVVYVVTQSFSVFAFDADDFSDVDPLWVTHFVSKIPSGTTNLLSTPCIDKASGTMYVCERHPDPSTAVVTYYLHALDIVSGLEKLGGPITVNATLPGIGSYNDGKGHVLFYPKTQQQRPSLLISHGALYLAFGSSGDVPPYHGWVITYDPATLRQLGAFCTTPDTSMAGIWMSGAGPAVDDNGNVYVVTGNGRWQTTTTSGYDDAVIKFAPGGSLQVADWFMPINAVFLDHNDLDLGVTGALTIPGKPYVITCGKEGKFYLIDQNNMGHMGKGGVESCLQEFVAANGHIHGLPVYYNGPNGEYLYVWSENDYLKAFKLTGGSINPNPVAQSLNQDAQGMPGGMLTLSAKGTTAGSAVVWSSVPKIGDAEFHPMPGVIQAFDAKSLGELWNSYDALVDDCGIMTKFACPTVANGKLYVSCQSKRLNVYGLLDRQPPQTPTKVVSENGTNAVEIFWDLMPNTTSYTILECHTSNGVYVPIATNVTTNSYIDTTAINGKGNYYEVVGQNGAGKSPASSQVYGKPTATPAATPFTYATFSAVSTLTLNGSANNEGGTLNLTDGAGEAAGSAFYATKTVQAYFFHSSFKFQFSGPNAHGITFDVQYNTTRTVQKLNSLGDVGPQLGYGPTTDKALCVANSVGLKYTTSGNPDDSGTGILYLGRDATLNQQSLAGTGVDFRSGRVFQADVSYDRVTLTNKITDTVTHATVTKTYKVNIPNFSSTAAYVGFTGSAGVGSSVRILSWAHGR